MYPQLIYLFKLRLFPNPKEATLKDATEWCKARAISNVEAVNKLFPNHEFVDVAKEFPQEMQEGQKIESSLPVQMGFGGDINLLYNLAKASKAQKVIETGVAHGWSSMAILLALTDQKTHLISTDMPYPKMGNEEFVGCVIPDQLKKKWTLIRKPDRQGLKIAFGTNSSIDLCHYDSDKTYVGRKWAYPLLWKHLNSNGIFISDDINDNIAFQEFSEELGIEPIIVAFEDKYIGIIPKKS